MWEAGSGAGVTAAPFGGMTVKIGFLNDATGPIAVYGPGFVAASQIAIGLANTIGYSSGVQFELVYADSGCDGDMGGDAGQALVDAGVWGAVGAACSGASMGATQSCPQPESLRFRTRAQALLYPMQQLTQDSSVSYQATRSRDQLLPR